MQPIVVDRAKGEKLDTAAVALRGRWAKLRALLRRQAVHHVHVSSPNGLKHLALCMFLLLLPRERACITFHNGRFPDYFERCLDRVALRLIGRSVAVWVVLNGRDEALLNRLDIRAKIVRTTSYLSPTEVENPGDQSPELSAFRATTRYLVVTSGYGVPNSGFEGVIDAIRFLGSDFGLVIVAYGEIDEVYMSSVRSATTDARVLLLTDQPPSQFRLILRAADAYVRNTQHDAFGLAVAEAVAVGTPALATDVCDRAEGAQTYPLGDTGTLIDLLAQAVEEPSQAVPPRGSGSQYLTLYRELLSDPSRQ